MAPTIMAFFVCFILLNLYLFYFYKTAKLLSTFILVGILPYLYCLFTKVPLGVDELYQKISIYDFLNMLLSIYQVYILFIT